jgi:hypothetical protein
MCGIFGILGSRDSCLNNNAVENTMKRLFMLSQSRGKEASGLAVRLNGSIEVLKEPIPASKFIKLEQYRNIFDGKLDERSRNGNERYPFAVLGHSRLVTNGSGELNINNQPVVKDGAVGIHNGIIVNDKELWTRFPSLKREYDVDTEVLLSLVQEYRRKKLSLIEAAKNTYQNIKGSASVSILFSDIDTVLLATNNGSLFFCVDHNNTTLIFASEKFILTQLVTGKDLISSFDVGNITQLKANNGCVVNLSDMQKQVFSLQKMVPEQKLTLQIKDAQSKINVYPPASNILVPRNPHALSKDVQGSMMKSWERIYANETSLKRCTRCLLPHTIPFIEFDKDGVCNYCHNHDRRQAYKVHGAAALEEAVAPYRSKNGEADCIVGFSGGRDSAYALDYVKSELRLNPIAFTFDWGMLTDLGRRNQSKICSDLGVENIIVSADIKQKRKNIQRNLMAWLKRPRLGMVPMLMAGDKQFYHYFHEIRKQTGVKLFIFAGGHKAEEDPFKYGFCGVKHGTGKIIDKITGVSLADKTKLVSFVLRNYLMNPAYINPSLIDTIYAFYCTYMLHDDYLYLFEYIDWDEDDVMGRIRKKFDWEGAPDTIATWRIDDGTAPFYNYIYMTVAGFTEFDHFRSTQIRDGKMTREHGLELVKGENKPRIEAIEWYANAVDFDCNKAVGIINSIPKLYNTVK